MPRTPKNRQNPLIDYFHRLVLFWPVFHVQTTYPPVVKYVQTTYPYK